MKKSRLRNKFLNTKSDIDRKACNKQRGICVTLIRQVKKNFYGKLKTRDITENKTFWKKVKSFFIDKIQTKYKITLTEIKIVTSEGEKVIESEEIISEHKAIAEVFNTFFINIVPNLKISIENDFDTNFLKTEDPVLNSIIKCKNHPSVIIIKEKNKLSEKFSFSPAQYNDIFKISKHTDISTKILKQNSEYFAEYFYNNTNVRIQNSDFPSELKSVDVTPVYKKVKKLKG